MLYSISCSDIIHSSRNVVTVHAINAYVGVETYIHVFLTSILEAERSSSHRYHSTPGTHSTGGWAGLTATLDALEKRKLLLLLKIETRFLSSLPHSLISITTTRNHLVKLLPHSLISITTMLNHLVKLLCQLYGL